MRTPRFWSDLDHRATRLMFPLELRHRIELLSPHRDHVPPIPDLFQSPNDTLNQSSPPHISQDLVAKANEITALTMLESCLRLRGTKHQFHQLFRTPSQNHSCNRVNL